MQNKKIENKLTSEDMELIRKDSTFEQKKKQDIYDTMMANIDNYDGTGLGQKDIPS